MKPNTGQRHGRDAATLASAAYGFVRDLKGHTYNLSVLDHVWTILFLDRMGTWRHLHVNQYKETFYITDVGGDCGTLEVQPGKTARAMDPMGRVSRCSTGSDDPPAAWAPLISDASHWLNVVRRDWIRANRRVHAEYPLHCRYGIVSHALVRASIPDFYRLDKESGVARSRRFVRLVEQGFFLRPENTIVASMTAADYFRYCKIAYPAGKCKGESLDESLPGQEMYARYADGRHEGLLDIDPNCGREFAEWIDGVHPERQQGGHPWEIKRGGNTTHIDLFVSRPSPYLKEGFRVELCGESIGRMAETLRMFLAIQEAGLPISITNPAGVRKRILAQDNIGIVPSYESLHRANQHFKAHEDVFDVMYFSAFGRAKRRLLPFITWEPLPILKPMG